MTQNGTIIFIHNMNIPKAMLYFKKPLFDPPPQKKIEERTVYEKKECLRIAYRIFRVYTSLCCRRQLR